MKLPARTEGPHCWLWLLLYREAGEISGAAQAGDQTREAGLLWERVVAGSLWVKRDRSGLSDENEPWLAEVVTAEAQRHLALSAELDEAGGSTADQRAAKAQRPLDQRLQAVSIFIWRQLGNGWARVADGEDAILFWHPEGSAFVPFSLELSARYAQLFGSRA